MAVLVAATFACGSSSPAASGPSTPCHAVAIKSERVNLTPTQSPTAGFKLEAATQPVGLILDRHGASVWALGDGSNTVIHAGPDGAATEYQLPASDLGLQLSQASDGTVWVPEQYRDAVMALAPDGSARECVLPRKSSEPMSTSVDAAGTVWVSEARGQAIAELAGDRWTEHPVGVPGVDGAEVISARGGGAWFSVRGGLFVGHVSSAGQVTRTNIGGSGTTLGLLEAADGALWVADFGGDRVVRVAPDGAVTALSTRSGAKPQSFAVAPDGAIWFTESGVDRLARVNGTQVDDSFRTGAWPDHMVITADGWAWFTEYDQNALGRVRLSA